MKIILIFEGKISKIEIHKKQRKSGKFPKNGYLENFQNFEKLEIFKKKSKTRKKSDFHFSRKILGFSCFY